MLYSALPLSGNSICSYVKLKYLWSWIGTEWALCIVGFIEASYIISGCVMWTVNFDLLHNSYGILAFYSVFFSEELQLEVAKVKMLKSLEGSIPLRIVLKYCEIFYSILQKSWFRQLAQLKNICAFNFLGRTKVIVSYFTVIDSDFF